MAIPSKPVWPVGSGFCLSLHGLGQSTFDSSLNSAVVLCELLGIAMPKKEGSPENSVPFDSAAVHCVFSVGVVALGYHWWEIRNLICSTWTILLFSRAGESSRMDRSTDSIFSYCRELVRSEGQELSDGTVFVKVLTSNDDSGRHGVVIPSEAHDFFLELEIPDRTQNATTAFDSCDCLRHRPKELKYKYYQRYPERRIGDHKSIAARSCKIACPEIKTKNGQRA